MIRFCVLGSGSSGNCIYISNGDSAILLDAGFSGKEIMSRMNDAGLDPGTVRAVVVTHEHIDHSRSAGIMSRKLKIPVYMNEKTHARVSRSIGVLHELEIFDVGDGFEVAGLVAESFAIPHDASDPCAFLFRSNGTRMAVITDSGSISTVMEDKVRDVDYLVVEANHNREMLMAGPYPWELKQRVSSRMGHLSNEQCAEFLKNAISPKLQGVTFAHLSETNNNPHLVRQMAEDELSGHNIEFRIAAQSRPEKVVVIE
ncbi:Metal-dependent hydrolases of the beta-lactamase superfamily I [hydrothermal vent metagenome]|uniref:Metal-dependent hydrolases of the beta-lactamase superfamily I n=1 Tax=hydrothermal vent metagenome TaxID=652676 RepID=A0A3B1BAK5_9ZZZZ